MLTVRVGEGGGALVSVALREVFMSRGLTEVFETREIRETRHPLSRPAGATPKWEFRTGATFATQVQGNAGSAPLSVSCPPIAIVPIITVGVPDRSIADACYK